jgi:hypothetical protein
LSMMTFMSISAPKVVSRNPVRVQLVNGALVRLSISDKVTKNSGAT